jgi:hypothetical protein
MGAVGHRRALSEHVRDAHPIVAVAHERAEQPRVQGLPERALRVQPDAGLVRPGQVEVGEGGRGVRV